MTFKLPILPFSTDALEPFMNQQTVEIHHGKHHAGYTTKLNKQIESEGLGELDLETDVFPKTDIFPKGIIINGGQYWNHSFFWDSIAPAGQAPSEKVMTAINDSFGGFDAFKEAFTKEASSVFGSGWTWLCQKKDGSLTLVNTLNHENPLMDSVDSDDVTPLLVIDVWEHAYYLKYQNRRPEFIAAFMEIINWEKVEERMA